MLSGQTDLPSALGRVATQRLIHHDHVVGEVDQGEHGRTRAHRRVDQVRVLETEPGGEGARVATAERDPAAQVAQAHASMNKRAERGQVSQGLLAAQIFNIIVAQVSFFNQSYTSLC